MNSMLRGSVFPMEAQRDRFVVNGMPKAVRYDFVVVGSER